MEAKIDNADQAWIDAGADDQIKASRKLAVLNLIEMNGLKFEPGIGKSYIPEKNFYQIVDDKNVSKNINLIAMDALNWDALGRGLGGLAGAGVRRGLRDMIDVRREVTVTNLVTPEVEAIIKEFVAYSAPRKDFIPFWAAQSLNVLGLAGAIFNREMHHWNAENTKPQQALIGSLNQTDTIPEGEFRKLFYLSIHPIPLRDMEELRGRIALGKVVGINDAVASRCRSAPASCGDIHACAQAVPDLKAEPYFAKFGKSIVTQLTQLYDLNNDILIRAANYHNFAANYGFERIIVDKVSFKRSMACLCAYIIVNIKGSLAQSAALKKFRNTNSRAVQRWINAFEAAQSDIEITLEQLVSD